MKFVRSETKVFMGEKHRATHVALFEKRHMGGKVRPHVVFAQSFEKANSKGYRKQQKHIVLTIDEYIEIFEKVKEPKKKVAKKPKKAPKKAVKKEPIIRTGTGFKATRFFSSKTVDNTIGYCPIENQNYNYKLRQLKECYDACILNGLEIKQQVVLEKLFKRYL